MLFGVKRDFGDLFFFLAVVWVEPHFHARVGGELKFLKQSTPSREAEIALAICQRCPQVSPCPFNRNYCMWMPVN